MPAVKQDGKEEKRKDGRNAGKKEDRKDGKNGKSGADVRRICLLSALARMIVHREEKPEFFRLFQMITAVAARITERDETHKADFMRYSRKKNRPEIPTGLLCTSKGYISILILLLFRFYFLPVIVIQFVAFLTEIVEGFQIVEGRKIRKGDLGIADILILDQSLGSCVGGGIGDVFKVH